MDTTTSLVAQSRTDAGRAAAAELRATGMIPAVLYGHGTETQALSINQRAITTAYKSAGESTLIDLTVDDGAAVKVLLHDIQRDPISNEISHVDLYQVRMDEKIHAEIELVFTGEAAAVKTLGGVFVHNLDSVEVECLPAALVHHIEVDVTALQTFEDTIRVEDLTIPEGIEVKNDPRDAVCLVTPPRSEAELEALDDEVVADVDAVEVEGAAEAEEAGAEAAEAEDKE